MRALRRLVTPFHTPIINKAQGLVNKKIHFVDRFNQVYSATLLPSSSGVLESVDCPNYRSREVLTVGLRTDAPANPGQAVGRRGRCGGMPCTRPTGLRRVPIMPQFPEIRGILSYFDRNSRIMALTSAGPRPHDLYGVITRYGRDGTTRDRDAETLRRHPPGSTHSRVTVRSAASPTRSAAPAGCDGCLLSASYHTGADHDPGFRPDRSSVLTTFGPLRHCGHLVEQGFDDFWRGRFRSR